MGNSPPMHMMSFSRTVFLLHRKLHHRFVRFYRFFESATEALKEYKDSKRLAVAVAASKSTKKQPVISLLSSDSESEDPDGSSTEEDA